MEHRSFLLLVPNIELNLLCWVLIVIMLLVLECDNVGSLCANAGYVYCLTVRLDMLVYRMISGVDILSISLHLQ